MHVSPKGEEAHAQTIEGLEMEGVVQEDALRAYRLFQEFYLLFFMMI